jgi:hypothetical protein
VFAVLPINGLARCLAGVILKLKPSGRFFATWYENPDPHNFEPIVHPSGITTHPDREPYHYPFVLVETVCHMLGALVERVDAPPSPRGEGTLVVTRLTPT